MPPPPCARSRALLVLAAFSWGNGGCRDPQPPPALASQDEAARYQALGETGRLPGQAAAAALYQAAADDPNEFLRARALEALYRLPELPPDPPGFGTALLKAIEYDPDLNRRWAACLGLRLKGVRGLRDAREVYATSENAETRYLVSVAAAEHLNSAELFERWRDEDDDLRHLVHEALRVQTKRRSGHYDGPPLRPAKGARRARVWR